jgi:protein-L-isoaspartate(D-aspartate) O-methyltransferase
MIDRCQFTPNGDNPNFPVPISDLCTVPTTEMAYLLASLIGDDAQDVLEIGTGSGYQTAVLAERCRSVVSIDVERHPGVSDRLPAHVALVMANGYEFDSGEQFDAVLVTFEANRISPMWAHQLRDGGILVVPVARGNSAAIEVHKREGDKLVRIEVAAYAPFTRGAEA